MILTAYVGAWCKSLWGNDLLYAAICIGFQKACKE